MGGERGICSWQEFLAGSMWSQYRVWSSISLLLVLLSCKQQVGKQQRKEERESEQQVGNNSMRSTKYAVG